MERKILKFKKLYKSSRLVMLSASVAEGAIFYGFACLSIDRGNLWWYLLALIFLVRTLKDIWPFNRKLFAPWTKNSVN